MVKRIFYGIISPLFKKNQFRSYFRFDIKNIHVLENFQRYLIEYALPQRNMGIFWQI
jgi:hypothetical protein